MIYKNNLIKIEQEPSQIPWLKIFVNRNVKEFSACTTPEKLQIFTALDVTEKLMLSYFKATKINIASFGNYLPQVHWHIMARFENDDFYPESMWGKKQRNTKLTLPNNDVFLKLLVKELAEKLT